VGEIKQASKKKVKLKNLRKKRIIGGGENCYDGNVPSCVQEHGIFAALRYRATKAPGNLSRREESQKTFPNWNEKSRKMGEHHEATHITVVGQAGSPDLPCHSKIWGRGGGKRVEGECKDAESFTVEGYRNLFARRTPPVSKPVSYLRQRSCRREECV